MKNPDSKSIVQSIFDASNKGEIHFGEVLNGLMKAQVESYHVDYRSGRSTYYVTDGTTFDFSFELAHEPIADAFDGDKVRAAIKGAQQGHVMYPEFKKLTQHAGCIGYTVWITGRHVSYLGRRGEIHKEYFPDNH